MAPGRPRKADNRDLPPGVYRRVRGGRARYYDADGKALGTLDKVFGATRLDEIRPMHIGAIRRELSAKPRWASVLITMVSIVWKHAHSYGLTDAPNPARAIKRPPNPPQQAAGLTEVRGIYAAPTDHAKIKEYAKSITSPASLPAPAGGTSRA